MILESLRCYAPQCANTRSKAGMQTTGSKDAGRSADFEAYCVFVRVQPMRNAGSETGGSRYSGISGRNCGSGRHLVDFQRAARILSPPTPRGALQLAGPKRPLSLLDDESFPGAERRTVPRRPFQENRRYASRPRRCHRRLSSAKPARRYQLRRGRRTGIKGSCDVAVETFQQTGDLLRFVKPLRGRANDDHVVTGEGPARGRIRV